MRSRARPRLFKSKFASGVPMENLLELLDGAYLFPAHRVDPAVAENSCIIYGRPERYFLGTLLNSKSHPRHHASDFAAMDLFFVSTIGFNLLYAMVIVRLDRRQLISINVTQHRYIARQRDKL